MFLFVIAVVVAVLVCILASLWTYARWNYGVLERMGVPVVEYTNPILGSTRAVYEGVGGEQDMEWAKKYGPIFGLYEGRQPQLFICIPELVRLMCVKDVEYFNSRRELDYGDVLMNEMPDFMPLEKWKVVRSITTPAFSSAKIKMMNMPMREATQDFVEGLKQRIKKDGEGGVLKKFAIDTTVHSMLTDLVGRCVFSVKFSENDDENSDFAKTVKEFLTGTGDYPNPEIMMYNHAFPFLQKLVPSSFYKPGVTERFLKAFKDLLDERRQSGDKRHDVVNLCLDWFEKLDTPEFKRLKITELTLITQALTFFFASQDQISTMVAAVIYHMTKDPKLEKRIYHEVDSIFAKHNGEIGHEHLSELKLLTSCIQECLRLYTVFHRSERICSKDWKNEEYNLDIKKGTVIMFPIWAINRNQEFTENAEQFDPDRFMPENKDKLNVYATTSFGHGPRNCPGKRFAMEAIPIILAYILKDLRFGGREDTQIKYTCGGPLYTPHEEIFVDVLERTK